MDAKKMSDLQKELDRTDFLLSLDNDDRIFYSEARECGLYPDQFREYLKLGRKTLCETLNVQQERSFKNIVKQRWKVIASVILLVALVSLYYYGNVKYEDGYANGYDTGYDAGYKDGRKNTKDLYAKARSSAVTVYITANGSKYHEKGCSYLSDSAIPISLPQAEKEGYAPCSKCNPP